MRALQDVPGVVHLHEYYDDGEIVTMVMDRPEGSVDLCHFLEKNGPLKEQAALFVFTGIASAVWALKEAGVVHNDIKLENVLFNPDTCEVHLVDFGSSFFVWESECPPGTMVYAPPEWLRPYGNPAYSEIWALGTLLYLLLTGYFPFDGEEEKLLKNVAVPKKCLAFTKHLLRKMLCVVCKQRIHLKEVMQMLFGWLEKAM